MHQLSRAEAPPCLNRYQHGRDNWSALSDNDRTEIRTQLETMQGKRCAYCECSLEDHGQHIEHFVQKGTDPRVTFDWDNLFWSCERQNSCGKYKDQKARPYTQSDLIKPDIENPEEFFHFHSGGTISIRIEDSQSTEYQRAKETLRIFNLDANHGPLKNMRKGVCAGYKQTGIAIAELLDGHSPEESLEFVIEEIRSTRDQPFATAIKHTLLPVSLHLMAI